MRILLLIGILFSGWLSAQPVLYFTDSTEELELGKYSAYLHTSQDQFSISDIIELPGNRFVKNESGLLFFEENKNLADVWLRFDILYFGKKTKVALVEVNNPLIDQISFYWAQDNFVLDSNLCGDDVPFDQRDIHYHNPIFKVRLEPNQYYSLFIKCSSDGRKMHIPVTIKSVNSFISSSSSKNLLLGMFYGILLTLTLFYFYLAIIIKEKPFLYLALYLFFLTLTQLAVGGIDNAYLWPNSEYLNNRSVPIYMGSAILLGLYFAKSFIGKSISKWILWPFRILFTIGLFSLILSIGSDQMLDLGMRLLYYLIPLDYGLLFVVGAYYLIKKIKIARFFALSFFAATTSIGLMVYYSINSNTDNVFTNNLVLYALIIKCVMLSIAMLDRVKIYKEENEKAQAIVIENLEEMTKIKENVNKELERKIQEKTTELLSKKNEVNRALIQGEERERKRLAQELHDGLGSLLATLKLNVESLNLESKGLSDFEWKAYVGLLEMVDYACKELRDISHNMLPAGIEHFGLDATLKSDISKLNKHKNLQLSLDTFGLKNINNKEIELHVYRIVLELINNVIKHANATKANIQLIMLDKHLSLILEDNGIGFNPEKTIHSGIGIISIKSRVEALSGRMQIDSMKHRGTSITIEIPVN